MWEIPLCNSYILREFPWDYLCFKSNQICLGIHHTVSYALLDWINKTGQYCRVTTNPSIEQRRSSLCHGDHAINETNFVRCCKCNDHRSCVRAIVITTNQWLSDESSQGHHYYWGVVGIGIQIICIEFGDWAIDWLEDAMDEYQRSSYFHSSFLSITQVLVLSTCLMDIGYGLCDVSIEWRVNLVQIH